MSTTGDTVVRLHGRAAIVAAAGDDAYTRMLLPDTWDGVVGFANEGAVGWFTELPWGSPLCVRGDPGAARDLLTELREAGLTRIGLVARLPDLPDSGPAPEDARIDEEWLFLSTEHQPPARTGEHDVVRLAPEAAGEITRLLSASFPDSVVDPSGPGVRQWFGIYRDGRLVACGADRSCHGVGHLAKITVDDGERGRGLGAALTVAMTRSLLAEFGTATLGVTVDNVAALRLYERLGYRVITRVTTYELLA